MTISGIGRPLGRVDESRYYRFCQNPFTQLEDYLDFFPECAGPDRRIALDVPDLPARYLDAPRWITQRNAMLEAVRARTDESISVLVDQARQLQEFQARGASVAFLGDSGYQPGF